VTTTGGVDTAPRRNRLGARDDINYVREKVSTERSSRTLVGQSDNGDGALRAPGDRSMSR